MRKILSHVLGIVLLLFPVLIQEGKLQGLYDVGVTHYIFKSFQDPALLISGVS